jgi:hypothetical protein
MIDSSKLSKANDKSLAYGQKHARKIISVGKRKNIIKCKDEVLTIVDHYNNHIGNPGNKKILTTLGDINLETQMANKLSSIIKDYYYLLKNVRVYPVITRGRNNYDKQ